MPDWSVTKTQTKNQSNRSSRIAGGLNVRLTTCSGKNNVTKSKEEMAGLSEIRQPMNRFKDLRIGSWNVLSLYRSKSLQMLLGQLEKYYVDITCVQEMRWIGWGAIEKKNCIIFYSCDNKEHKLGIGFVIHKKVKHLIMDFQPKSPWMCRLRVRGKFFNYSVINVHAPTEDKSDTEKYAFYDGLRNLYDTCPKLDLKLTIGDLNAQIGKEALYYPTIGKEAFHQESNENGKMKIHLAASRNKVIGTTLIPHTDIQKITWRSPDIHHFSQVDYLLTDSRHVSHLTDARTHRCANVDSDHFLLVS